MSVELTQIHDLIIQLFILHQKKKNGWHMHGSDVSAEAVMIGRCRRMTQHQLKWCKKIN